MRFMDEESHERRLKRTKMKKIEMKLRKLTRVIGSMTVETLGYDQSKN